MRCLALAVLLVAAGLLSSCTSVRYLAQSVGGHLEMLNDAKPVQQWIDDAQTPAALRDRLALSQRMRDFAISELKLPDNASYRRYADLHRSAVIWNVAATSELSLSLKTWCFPVVGCVGYRGYFDRSDADAFAAELRGQGLEVIVYGVPAYSTLGRIPGDFFSDPLLNTFINYPEGELARMVFHELAHQVAFAKDDTMFNESFATTVEKLGAERWLTSRATPAALDEYRRFDARRQEFRALTARYRARLDALFRSDVPDEEKRAGKARVMQEMRAEYVALRDGVSAGAGGGMRGYDTWFERANNASLAIMGAYNELVPSFEQLLAGQGGDLDRFYAEVRRLATLPKAERRAALKPDVRTAATKAPSTAAGSSAAVAR